MTSCIDMSGVQPNVPGAYVIWFRPDLDLAPAFVLLSDVGSFKRPEAPFPLSLQRKHDIVAWFGPIPDPDEGLRRAWVEGAVT
jgi:hypothetical protein